MVFKRYLIFSVLILLILSVGVLFHLKSRPNKSNPALAGNSKVLGAYDKKQPSQNTQLATTDPTNQITDTKILFVGDIMLARSIGQKIQQGQDPFVNVKSFFAGYDLVVANLETTIGSGGKGVSGKTYTFQAPVKSAQILSQSGIKLVSLANNHTMDYGGTGLKSTIDSLSNQQIGYFGAGNNQSQAFTPKVLKINDNSIALIGVNDIENNFTNATSVSPGSANIDLNKIKTAVESQKNNGSLVIVVPHWGEEYKSVTSRQKSFAKSILEFGADAIIGSHPHIIQENQIIDQKPVYYSMGNFVFDQMSIKPGATKSQMIEVIINNNKIKSTRAINIQLDKNGFPQLSK